MDEMTLLRDMRSSTPSPHPATLARHRRKVMAGIGAAPAAAETLTVPAKTGRPKMRSRIALMAAAAAFLVGVMVTADVVLPDRGRASAEAAEVLHNAAAATIQASDPVLQPGQYLKIETRELTGSSIVSDGVQLSWQETTGGQLYIPADVTGEWIWNREARLPTDSAPEAVQEAARLRPTLDPDYQAAMVGVFRAEGGAFSGPEYTILGAPLTDTSELPRDPRKLLDLIYERTKDRKDPDIKAFEAIMEALRTGVIPADLRAAFYQAAALIPGVDVTDGQAMVDGRTGIAIGIPGPGGVSRNDLIIDPVSGMVIGEQIVLLQDHDGAAAGTIESWRSVRTSVVDSAP